MWRSKFKIFQASPLGTTFTQLGFSLAGLLVLMSLYGLQIDHTPELTQPEMFIAIHIAGLSAIGLVFTLLFPKLPNPISKGLFIIGLFVAWRISYFPLMVFSGHVASIGEWLLAFLPESIPIIVFPTFLIALSGFNAFIACIVWYLVRPNSYKPAYAVAIIPATVATMISFTTPSDLQHWLPDSPWETPKAIPAVSMPKHNPYIDKFGKPGYTIPQNTLLFAASNTYDFIPESPWARVVKGVLEAETNANPVGTSADRIIEHHLGYLSAHRFIGCHYNDTSARCQHK